MSTILCVECVQCCHSCRSTVRWLPTDRAWTTHISHQPVESFDRTTHRDGQLPARSNRRRSAWHVLWYTTAVCGFKCRVCHHVSPTYGSTTGRNGSTPDSFRSVHRTCIPPTKIDEDRCLRCGWPTAMTTHREYKRCCLIDMIKSIYNQWRAMKQLL